MTDSNDQDRKKVLSLSGKGKLELKNKPAADNSVRQSFSHGRSKTVTVEVKRKRTIEKGAAPGVADGGAAARRALKKEIAQVREAHRLLADAMEAVIAALYLDAGLETTRSIVLSLWGDRIDRVDADARDAKTQLQEWAQARGLSPPRYIEKGRSGPDHAPVFTIEVQLDNGETATAKAKAKRQAEQAAARMLLDRLEAGEG